MKKSITTIVTDVIMLILLYFVFLCAIIADKYTIIGNFIFHGTFSNYDINPIVEVDISRWRCKSEFQPLFNFSYLGHNSACYDPTNGTFHKETSKSKCGANENFLFKIDQTPMIGWKGKVICVRRENYKNHSYIENSKNKCAEGFKFCGFADYSKDKLCVKEGKDCPIFFFEINKSNSYNTTEEELNSNPLDDEYSLFYSNNSTKMLQKENAFIKIDFKIANEFPCIEERFSPIGQMFPLILDENKDKFGCKSKNSDQVKKNIDEYYYTEEELQEDLNQNNTLTPHLTNESDYFDYRFKEMDSYSLEKFNEDNDLEILNKLPKLIDYTPNTSLIMKLYSRPYIYPNFTCTDKSAEFLNFNNFYNDLKGENFVLNIIILSNLISLCLFISLLSLMKITSKNQNLIISFIKIISCFGFILFIFFQVSDINSRDKKLFDIFISIQNSNCFDDVSKLALREIFYFKETYHFKMKVMFIIYYTCYVYLVCLVIQLFKYVQKLTFRLKNHNKTKNAKEILDFVINNK